MLYSVLSSRNALTPESLSVISPSTQVVLDRFQNHSKSTPPKTSIREQQTQFPPELRVVWPVLGFACLRCEIALGYFSGLAALRLPQALYKFSDDLP